MDLRLRWVGPTLVLLLVGLIAAGGSGADIAPAAPRRLTGTAGAACPLTSSQEKTAVIAFEEMMPVIRHPRSSNCHGGVNPFKPEADGGHGGGEMDLPEVAKQCRECHSELPGWTVTSPPMFFPGRSSKQICKQFKQFAPTGADFVGHMQHENGGIQFIAAAFKGKRLEPVRQG